MAHGLRRGLLMGALLQASLSGPLPGQDSTARPTVKPVPAVARHGKWVALGAAVGMGILAARAHADAETAFDRLRNYCFTDTSRCDLGSGGRYLDPVTEHHYQASLAADRRARRWLYGGEAAMLAATALLIWDLSHPRPPPDNIPFSPRLSFGPDDLRLGMALPF